MYNLQNQKWSSCQSILNWTSWKKKNPEIWYSWIITNESTFPLIILWSPFQRWLKLFFSRCGYRFNANLVFLVVFITAIKSGSLTDFVWHEGFHQAKWFSPSGNVKFRKNIINYIRQVSIIHHAHILKSLGGPFQNRDSLLLRLAMQ